MQNIVEDGKFTASKAAKHSETSIKKVPPTEIFVLRILPQSCALKDAELVFIAEKAMKSRTRGAVFHAFGCANNVTPGCSWILPCYENVVRC